MRMFFSFYLFTIAAVLFVNWNTAIAGTDSVKADNNIALSDTAVDTSKAVMEHDTVQNTNEAEKELQQEKVAEDNSLKVKSDDIKCPRGMVGIKTTTGRFVKRSHSFCIDVYEFPNTKGKFPMTKVTWTQAMQYCKERGKRLCKDDEWMVACRGPQKFKYPYGNKYEKEKCVTGRKYYLKTGAKEKCSSFYGVYDMAGNVSEWTSGGGIVSFGGYWKSGKSARCDKWNAHSIDGKYDRVGFRCCLDAVDE